MAANRLQYAQQRRQQALKLLGDGYGCTELVAKLAEDWGCSRRSSRRYVSDAYGELVADLNPVQSTEMLASVINRLEATAHKSFEQGQYACVIGACKLLAELALTPYKR